MTPAGRKHIQRFDNACQDLAFKGSQHPDDWGEIEARHAEAKKALENYIEGLLNKAKAKT